MPDSHSKAGCREKLRTPCYRDNPVYPDSHTLMHRYSRRPPTSGSSPDFSTFTFTGNMLWVWALASWVRGAPKGLGSQVKAGGRRGEVKGKLRVLPILRSELCPAATAETAATFSSFLFVGGLLSQLLVPISQCNRRPQTLTN